METVKTHQLPPQQQPQAAAKIIFDTLQQTNFFSKKRTIFLLSGGSSIDVAASLLELLPVGSDLGNVTIALADERWVELGSPDSNEQQLRDKGVVQKFQDRGAQFLPMLGVDSDPLRSAEQLDASFKELFSETEAVVLLAGMGADGHTMGILPSSDSAAFFEKFSAEKMVTYYELPDNQDNPFKKRLTLTFSAIAKVSHLFLYAVGESKKTALQHFYQKDKALNLVPVLGLYLTEAEPQVLTNISV